MEEKRPRIAIIGAGFIEAEAQVALLKEKYGDDVVLIDGDSVADLRPHRDPFDPEPFLVKPCREVFDYEAICKDLNDEWNKVPRSDRRGTVASVRNSKEDPKIQRNAPCPCNSGKKYKNCCGK